MNRNKYSIGVGTACYQYVSFIDEYRGWLIYHHQSHPDYVNRFTGSVSCEAHFGIIKKSDWEGCHPNLRVHKFLYADTFHIRKCLKSIQIIKDEIDRREGST